MEVSYYAVSIKIQYQPSFSWCVPYTLKKLKYIIQKVKSRYWQHAQKFGSNIPKLVKEALKFDKENNNNLWGNSIRKDMPKIEKDVEE